MQSLPEFVFIEQRSSTRKVTFSGRGENENHRWLP